MKRTLLSLVAFIASCTLYGQGILTPTPVTMSCGTHAQEQKLWAEHPEWKDGHPHLFEGNAIEVNYVQRSIELAKDMELLAYVSSDDGLRIWLNEELIFEKNP